MLKECRGLFEEDKKSIRDKRNKLAAGRQQLEERIAQILTEAS